MSWVAAAGLFALVAIAPEPTEPRAEESARAQRRPSVASPKGPRTSPAPSAVPVTARAEKPVDQPAPEGARTPPPKRKRTSGLVYIAPGGMAQPYGGVGGPSGAAYQAIRGSFLWGFGAGLHWLPHEHWMLDFNAAFEHQVYIFNNRRDYELCYQGDCYTERGLGGLLRVGIEIRTGLATRWVSVFGEVVPSLALSHVRLDCGRGVGDECDRKDRDVGLGIGGGGGFLIHPTHRIAFGASSGVDVVRFDEQDDPFRAVHTWELKLLFTIYL